MSAVVQTLMALLLWATPAHSAPGDLAPDFELSDFEGAKRKLGDYKGQVLVLEWTCTECPFTLEHYERGTMAKTYEKFKDKVKWLAIDSSYNTSDARLYNWAQRWKVMYPIALDPSGVTGKKYGATATPHMFVIDAKGVLRYEGAIDDDSTNSKKQIVNLVDAALTSLLAGEPVKVPSTKPYGCGVKYGKSPFGK